MNMDIKSKETHLGESLLQRRVFCKRLRFSPSVTEGFFCENEATYCSGSSFSCFYNIHRIPCKTVWRLFTPPPSVKSLRSADNPI